MKRCFFIGHRDAGERVFSELRETVLEHAEEYGVREFVVEQYGNFDRMSARAVMEIKKEYPDICLTLLRPYHPGRRTAELPEGFDGSFYPFHEPVPIRLAIVLANEKAICACDYLIAYVNRPGKSRDFLEMAEKREEKGLIRITNPGNGGLAEAGMTEQKSTVSSLVRR